jgi:Ca2+-binding RTX toxin-like protein
MSNIYLNLDENRNGGLLSGDVVFGNSGTEGVTVASGITGVRVNQAVEGVTLTGTPSAFTFKAEGNNLVVYSAGVEVARIIVQDDDNGTVLNFGNGVTSVRVVNGGLAIGGTAVRTDAAAPVVPGDLEPGNGGTPGQTFVLTEGADTIQGQAGNLVGSGGTVSTAGDDVIVAGTSVAGGISSNNLGSGDNINGGAGIDTLNIVDSGTNLLPVGTNIVPTLSGIEIVNAQAAGANALTLNLTNARDIEQLWSDRSTEAVNANNIQEEAVLGLRDTSATLNANFDVDVDLGGDIAIVAEDVDAGATVNITGGNGNPLRSLSIASTGSENELNLGTVGPLVNVTVVGDGDLILTDTGANLDTVTSFDASDANGDLTVDLLNSGKNMQFLGAAGDNTVRFGAGNNTITTQGGDDAIDVSAGGNQTVTLGAGDDYVSFFAAANKADKADGGEGTDTIGIEVAQLASLTSNATFEGSISNFEQVYVQREIADGEAYTLALTNLDDINYVILDGSEAGDPAIQEVQSFTVSAADATGGEVVVGGVRIAVPQNATSTEVASVIAAAQSQLQAANPSIASVQSVGDEVVVTYLASADNVANIIVGDNPSGSTFGAVTQADGVNQVYEQQTITVIDSPAFTGVFTIDGVPINVVLGENQAQTADRIATALEAADRPYTAVVSGTSVVLTYTVVGNPGNVVVSDPGNLFVTDPSVAETRANVPAAGETQTVQVLTGTDTTGGEITVGGARISLAANLSVDQVGGAIAAAVPQLQAADSRLTGVAYDTATNTLTFSYQQSAGNVSPIVIGDNGSAVAFSVVNAVTQGDAGTAGGLVTLSYAVANGTLELTDAQNGTTNVVVPGTVLTDGDEFNIVLDQENGVAHNGVINLNNLEVLNVRADVAVTATDNYELNVNGPLEEIVVAGTAGVFFQTALSELTLFDASAVTGTGDVGSVVVQTTSNDDAVFLGGAGNDALYTAGGDDIVNAGAGNDFVFAGSGNDTVDGGEGNDFLYGGLGADRLTGGAGSDVIAFTDSLQSNGTATDLIVDFTAGTLAAPVDRLGFNFGVTYQGQANGYGAVLTELTGLTGEAIYDTQTNSLYVDVNGDAALTDADYKIDFGSAVVLNQSNFIVI